MRANAITMMGQRKPDGDARGRAMVRLNGMMFYSLGLASFLESTAPLDTERLVKLAQGHDDVRAWLERVWLQQRADRGRLLREYIESTWVEFDWGSAYQDFQEAYGIRSAAWVGPPGLALEFLARCVNEAALSVFYRTLAKSADEPALRVLVSDAAREHASYFSYFRGLYGRLRGRKRAGFATAVRAVLASCRAAREVDVATAFHPLAQHWHGGWVFPELTYAEFLSRLADLIKHRVALGSMERLLFRPWLNPPRHMETLQLPAKSVGVRKGAASAPNPRGL